MRYERHGETVRSKRIHRTVCACALEAFALVGELWREVWFVDFVVVALLRPLRGVARGVRAARTGVAGVREKERRWDEKE